MKTQAKIRQVLIDRVDGTQTQIDAGDEVYGPVKQHATGNVLHSERCRVGLEDIPQILAHPDGWIDHPTETRYEPEEEWREPDEWQPAMHRIYARGVISVLVLEDEG